MSFVPIQLRDYVRKHLKSNPGSNERDVIKRLRRALAAYKAGARCNCGDPGSSARRKLEICASRASPAKRTRRRITR